METVKKQKKGFALMTPEQRRNIARMGGKETQRKQVGHHWTSETAREAGKKGGPRGGRGRKSVEQLVEVV